MTNSEQQEEKLTLLSLAHLPLQQVRTWSEFKASHCLSSNLWPGRRAVKKGGMISVQATKVKVCVRASIAMQVDPIS